MSCVFIRPVLQDGYVPSASGTYDDPGDYASWPFWSSADLLDVVDAQHILDVWALLFAKVNGNLNSTDLSQTNTENAVDESDLMVNPEGAYVWPTVGQRHSHDGIDSARLASAIITQVNLPVSAFGMFRSLTDAYTRLLFGMYGYETGLARSTALTYASDNRRTLAMPWYGVSPEYLWDDTVESGGAGTVRIIMQAMVPDIEKYSATQRALLYLPRIHKSHYASGYTDAVQYFYGNTQYNAADADMFSLYAVQWAALGLY